MRSVPQSTKIRFNLPGYMHLICVENQAINIVYSRIKTLNRIPKNLQILQLGKIGIMKEALNIEQFDSMKDLKAKFNEICDCAYMGMRFYAVGSEKFVWNLRNYARSFGLSEEEISLEVVGSNAKDIDCSNCQTINSSVRTNIILFPSLFVK